ncbi:unnamed protein product [Trichogramma brassicae]|uniref:Reverse transcriptase domain-containing protein n=1 Tax=Trichogramma brassicae TaxID=86971 RepID=A0A6H5IGV2_9HYME|nr:unnamed protein product [Trichogramma brassicae]
MYRQIQIDDADVKWQRILWRCRPEDTLQQYDLTTVTYETACAPYLALRVMQQLADDRDEESRFPTGARILRKHMYVDDVLVSCDSEAEAIDARTSLTSILQSAGMELDKWASNYPFILPQGHTTAAPDLTFNKELSVPTLRLRWIPMTDVFSYTHLWLLGHDWDQLADPTTIRTWISFREQLPALQQCQIPRWLGTRSKSNVIYHGFSDASKKAYGATVYLVSENKAHLLAAKSKVAPIRTVSLPRLELCGATLLSRLMSKTLEDLGTSKPTVYCWTNSQIVLAWLRSPPNTWKTFVANRVSEVHTLLPNASWGHVVSKQNPADLASRG